jgi:hypothetical protein
MESAHGNSSSAHPSVRRRGVPAPPVRGVRVPSTARTVRRGSLSSQFPLESTQSRMSSSLSSSREHVFACSGSERRRGARLPISAPIPASPCCPQGRHPYTRPAELLSVALSEFRGGRREGTDRPSVSIHLQERNGRPTTAIPICAVRGVHTIHTLVLCVFCHLLLWPMAGGLLCCSTRPLGILRVGGGFSCLTMHLWWISLLCRLFRSSY